MYGALEAILQARGIVAESPQDFRVQDDGEGPYLAYWDARKLGAEPTAGEIAAVVVPPATSEVRKLLVVDRLNAAGLFDAAMTALDAQPRLIRERWLAATVIASDDAHVRGLIAGIGGNPDAILAKE